VFSLKKWGNGGEGMKKKVAVIAALAIAAIVAGAAVLMYVQTAPRIEEESGLPREYPSSTVKKFLKYALSGDYNGASRYLYDNMAISSLLHYFDNFVGKDVAVKILNEGIKGEYATVVFGFYQDNTQITETMCVLLQRGSEWSITFFDEVPKPFW
jgi:hypothetical protein